MKYINLMLEHMYISFIALVISLLFSIILVYIGEKNNTVKKILLNMTTLVYAIPSLSLFSLLVPFTGLGKVSVIISLVVYSQYILVRSFITLLDNFDKDLLLASHAMGLTEKIILFKIKIPLLQDAIIGSIKISISTIISIANIGAIVNSGGIGVLIFNGLRTMSAKKILIAILLNALVYLIFERLLKIIVLMIRKYKWED